MANYNDDNACTSTPVPLAKPSPPIRRTTSDSAAIVVVVDVVLLLVVLVDFVVVVVVVLSAQIHVIKNLSNTWKFLLCRKIIVSP